MTRTRYMADLLGTTNYHVAEYERELREAKRNGTSRREAVRLELPTFSHEMERRFEQTIGVAKALVAMATAAPRTTCAESRKNKKAILGLFKTVHDDARFLADRFAEHDFDHSRLEDVCGRLIAKCDATLKQCRTIIAAIEAESFEPREREYWGIKLAAPAVLARVALDYELLVEQFIDFMREDQQATVQPLGEAA